jgi:hypothetical protein
LHPFTCYTTPALPGPSSLGQPKMPLLGAAGSA